MYTDFDVYFDHFSDNVYRCDNKVNRPFKVWGDCRGIECLYSNHFYYSFLYTGVRGRRLDIGAE